LRDKVEPLQKEATLSRAQALAFKDKVDAQQI
jgi:hypothetical protein